MNKSKPVCPRSSDPLYKVSHFIKWVTTSWTYAVCPGSSDPPEKKFNIFASENEDYTISNYDDTIG